MSTIWNKEDYFDVTFEVKQRNQRRFGDKQSKETYAVVTVNDKSESIKGVVKSFIINDPSPKFLLKIKENPELLHVIHKPVLVRMQDGSESTKKFVVIELDAPSGRVVVTNCIEKQVLNLSKVLSIAAYSIDGGKHFVSVVTDDDDDDE